MTDGLSGRYHSTFGRGFPLTLQHKLTFVPRLRITSFGGLLVNLGGSRGKISDCHIKIRLESEPLWKIRKKALKNTQKKDNSLALSLMNSLKA